MGLRTELRAVVGVLIVALGAAIAVYAFDREPGNDDRSADANGHAPAEDRTNPELPPPLQQTATPPAGDASAGRPLRLPDGSETAPLNGVTKPAPMTWGSRPYSPITDTVWSDGVEWYVHENGTRTTTLDLWRNDLGRYDAVTVVVHSGEPSPIDQLDSLGPIRGRRR